MMPPQPMGQCQQPYFLSCCALTGSAPMSLYFGKSIIATPSQFLAGASSDSQHIVNKAAVPKPPMNSERGFLSARCFLLISFEAASSATGTFMLPFTAIALSFLEPMTAPRPERPAALPLLFITAAMRLIFSPEGPIQATSSSLPCVSLSISCVSKESLPQSLPASFNSALPLSINKYTGLSDFPVKNTASYPANLRKGPTLPPELASPQPPVSGDFPTMIYLEPPMASVPVSTPVTIPSMASVPNGSTPAFCRLKRIAAPRAW